MFLPIVSIFSFQRDFAVGICNKISEMIQGMYILFSNMKRLNRSPVNNGCSWLLGIYCVLVII